VGRQEVDRLLAAVIQLDFQFDGIGLEVDEPVGREVLGFGLRAPVQVDDQIGRPIEPREFTVAQTEAAAIVVQRVESPVVAKVEPLHHAGDEVRR
jgi:hypothetical protein